MDVSESILQCLRDDRVSFFDQLIEMDQVLREVVEERFLEAEQGIENSVVGSGSLPVEVFCLFDPVFLLESRERGLEGRNNREEYGLYLFSQLVYCMYPDGGGFNSDGERKEFLSRVKEVLDEYSYSLVRGFMKEMDRKAFLGGGYYCHKGESISFSSIDSESASEFHSRVEDLEFSEFYRPLVQRLVSETESESRGRSSGENFQDAVLHEGTHAYLDLKNPNAASLKESRTQEFLALEEGCAWTVSYILGGSGEIPFFYTQKLETSRDQLRLSNLYFREKLKEFEEDESDYSTSELISRIRSEGEEVLKRFGERPNIDIREALFHDQREDLKHLERFLYYFDRVERRTYEVVDSFGFEDDKFLLQYMKVAEAVDNELVDNLTGMDSFMKRQVPSELYGDVFAKTDKEIGDKHSAIRQLFAGIEAIRDSIDELDLEVSEEERQKLKKLESYSEQLERDYRRHGKLVEKHLEKAMEDESDLENLEPDEAREKFSSEEIFKVTAYLENRERLFSELEEVLQAHKVVFKACKRTCEELDEVAKLLLSMRPVIERIDERKDYFHEKEGTIKVAEELEDYCDFCMQELSSGIENLEKAEQELQKLEK